MMPLLRSLVDATAVTSTNGPETLRVVCQRTSPPYVCVRLHKALRRTRRSALRIGGDNFCSRKDLILNQYNRRVQKTWPRTGPRHGHQAAVPVHQSHPFGRSRGSVDLLSVRDAV